MMILAVLPLKLRAAHMNYMINLFIASKAVRAKHQNRREELFETISC